MQFYLELVGYLASVLVLISLMMSSLLKLRLINLAGAFFFVIYGYLISAYPIIVVNFIIVLVDLYYLYQMFKSSEYFSLMSVSNESAYLHQFLDYYREDIEKYIPDYRFSPDENQLIVFILRDLVPAGLFVGKIDEDGSLNVYLDFVVPRYRDFKIGRYLFSSTPFFKEHNIQQLKSTAQNPTHEKYLRHMGFQKETNLDGQPVYSLSLQTST